MLSIHAPTRGATLRVVSWMYLFNFQSTLLQEERPSIVASNLELITFNPRSYKRSDFVIFMITVLHFAFNPRSYKRSDSMWEQNQPVSLLSIHAPTRGATSAFNASDYQPNLSIHAPTRGATMTLFQYKSV